MLFSRLAHSSQYSEDSESGEVLRKRFHSSTREEEEDEETDFGILKSKKRRKSWNDQEATSSYSHEVCACKAALPTLSISLCLYVKLFLGVPFSN